MAPPERAGKEHDARIQRGQGAGSMRKRSWSKDCAARGKIRQRRKRSRRSSTSSRGPPEGGPGSCALGKCPWGEAGPGGPLPRRGTPAIRPGGSALAATDVEAGETAPSPRSPEPAAERVPGLSSRGVLRVARSANAGMTAGVSRGWNHCKMRMHWWPVLPRIDLRK